MKTWPPLILSIPRGDAAVPYTLAAMRVCATRLAKRYGATIREIVSKAGGTGTPAQAIESIFRAFSTGGGGYAFRRDPRGMELIRNHDLQLAQIRGGELALGDCDDRATLIAAAMKTMGIDFRFICIGRSEDSRLEHVLAAALIGADLVPIDPQESDAAGKFPRHGRRYVEVLQ